jgi:ribulose-bisphosphate carboxylase large chain
LDRILATYRIDAPESAIGARAAALAVEQSVEMPLAAITLPHVLESVVARVESIRPASGGFDVVIAIAAETTGFEASQLLNMLFGNCSLQPDVELLDVTLPAAVLQAFRGPRFGIAGLREATGAHGRPLTCSALKPQGAPVEHLARLAHTFALAGIDVIKDDHGIANQAYGPFEERVAAVQQAIDDANRETGGRTIYAPTFSGGPAALQRQLAAAQARGVRAALAAPMLIGVPAFIELCEAFPGPVLAHPAFAGADRIAPPLWLGKLFRLFGADATIFPNHGGRFSYSRATCIAIATEARAPLGDLHAALPVPAGGMSVERVPEMVADYGEDVMLLIGGGLLAARERLLERTREFVAAAAT